MKKILGLDLGTTSIGWAIVNEAENEGEESSIIRLGVRVNPLTTDESSNFDKGKSIETNVARRIKRSTRRNLQRYKLRREALHRLLKEHGFITDESILSEHGNRTTFETYRLRAKAVTEEISLEELSRVLLMINKKRGYKSSRKAKGNEDGKLIDGMEAAKLLYDNGLTPGELCLNLLKSGKGILPDFYRSDLQNELNRVWRFQSQFYPDLLTELVKEEITGKNKSQTWAILAKHFVWKSTFTEWDNENSCNKTIEKESKLTGIKREKKGHDKKIENYEWRKLALTEKMEPEKLAIVIQEINGEIHSSSGYLGGISDRSKSLYFNNLTVGQALMQTLDANPHASLKNMVYYRQDYLAEFEAIWRKQTEFHKELTEELKHEIRDIIIFYQRRLKSQKSLINLCEFERKDCNIIAKDGKSKTIVIGRKVIPRSSPLFQEFKIWQTLNNIVVSLNDRKPRKHKRAEHTPSLFDNIDDTDFLQVCGKRYLTQDEKKKVAEELSIRDKMSKTEILKLLFDNPSQLELNFKSIDGNKTGWQLYSAFRNILELSGHEPISIKSPAHKIKEQISEVFSALKWNTNILDFNSQFPLDSQDQYRLWHLLYSFEGDNTPTGEGKLIEKVAQLCGMEKEYAKAITAISFINDYGSLSAKAIAKIMPYLKDGNQYDVACGYAGYRHSASSLTKDEICDKTLKDYLEILPKNSLRNPVVEKILNQMVNVVNEIINTYGRPDEIRVELARELKKNQKERDELSRSVARATKEHEGVRALLQSDFGIQCPTRNDIIRYRLYEELRPNGHKTLYSDTYIPKEKLFSKEFDIEHIIPKARLFDDSFSNKTLEARSVNIEKGNKTAYDFVLEKYGEEGLERYLKKCEDLFSDKKTKLRKLKMQESEIPDDFIERDLRNTQYIAKRALAMLGEICRRVVATTGSITDQLRNDWQLVDAMKELNWEKYSALELVEYHQDRNGRQTGRIKDWTKRNDHRHHAMDALTVAFTKDVFIQYFNNKNASNIPNTNEYAIKTKYFDNGKAVAPIPLQRFRTEAKKHLANILISIKAKNKVVTLNVNKTKAKGKERNLKVQQTPRGQLHLETLYGSHKEYSIKEEKVNASFDEAKIMTVTSPAYRAALLWRLQQYGNDSKKAFTGKNALEKNPIWLDNDKTISVPIRVKTSTLCTVYTIRKPIDETLRVDKVVDLGVRKILQERIERYNGDAKKAFANLEEDPIWQNKEKGIKLKRVTIYGISNAQAIHEKRNKDGRFLLDENGNRIPVDFVNTGNNHHVAIYQKPVSDKKGAHVYNDDGTLKYELEERVVSFYEAVARVNQGLPAVDKEYKSSEGWKFLFTMKQNEYFVFPNEATGFDPKEIDLMNPNNYAIISPNLFRVQKFSSKYYVFRQHLETNVEERKELQNITWKRINSFSVIDKIVKVRINHIGHIVHVGEY
ncbi:MAG: type II CRISPR RNA-guided endonuclease Cas9 [Bacteroidales bacterium]|nr:type II CRISPR RNA-guided endonuclease Cas9 [Bacteroidales bacterium]MCM1148317.1 type II CRISPR RNA-guided endonuclease Cas9 [Bacteroidales bacterium]MCM1206991.1 type II CRISPR RNA-guided endonuclease Cas9 [Bacillota bacterium]MCM1511288.1 type II CRISPR RNA-guided endonuclease Cas9 [Clostridium sp.]